MELRTLRSFLTVAREGNITRAARALHITQPALSRQLLELERELGCELLVRESRGVTLTDEGVLLRKRADEIVELAQRTEQEIRSPQASIEGDVWIGGGESRAMGIVAHSAAALMAEHPNIRLRLYSGNADSVIERLEKGLLDFGLLMGRQPGAAYERLDLPWQDRWGALMPKDHPFAERPELALDDLRNERLIISAQDHANPGNHMPAQSGLQKRGFAISATYTLLYNASLLVEQGAGLAICLDGIVATNDGSPLRFVPLSDVAPIPSCLIWKRYAPLSRAGAAFLKELRSACA